jgi:Fe-S-cluster-containing dehydrogenase component
MSETNNKNKDTEKPQMPEGSDAGKEDVSEDAKKGLTRRHFAGFAGAGIAVLVAAGALTKWGVVDQAIASGRITLRSTPTKMILTDRAKCSGCQRCEMSCTLKNDGRSCQDIARVRLWQNYNQGPRAGSGEGISGDFQYTQEFCKQCSQAACLTNCPQAAIYADPDTGTRLVDGERCIGCGICSEACPWNMPVIDKETGKSTKCVACGRCAEQCPNEAIQFIDWKDVYEEYLKGSADSVMAEGN